MSEEQVARIFEMISAAGTAKAKYLEAVAAAKKKDYESAGSLMTEGGKCFQEAHHVHAEMLAEESEALTNAGTSSVNLILVHAEDQMMNAETFRIVAEELIEVHKQLQQQKGEV